MIIACRQCCPSGGNSISSISSNAIIMTRMIRWSTSGSASVGGATSRARLLSSATTTTTSSASTTTSTTTSDARQRAAHAFYQKQSSTILSSWRNKLVQHKKKKQQQGPTTGHQRNVNTAWYAAAVVAGALGATYAAVPLYKVFCQTTGFGGTTQRVRIESTTGSSGNGGKEGGGTGQQPPGGFVQSAMEKFAAAQLLRSVGGARVHSWTDEDAAARLASLKPVANADLLTIQFDTTVGDVLPWTFEPVVRDLQVVPGETALAFFRVTNRSSHPITGVATYNVHPPKLGLYFQKVQCFCFEEQRLLPGETVEMPVFFFIDPDVLDDPQVSYVRSITWSYTFFQTDEEEDDDDDEEDDDNDDAAVEKKK